MGCFRADRSIVNFTSATTAALASECCCCLLSSDCTRGDRTDKRPPLASESQRGQPAVPDPISRPLSTTARTYPRRGWLRRATSVSSVCQTTRRTNSRLLPMAVALRGCWPVTRRRHHAAAANRTRHLRETAHRLGILDSTQLSAERNVCCHLMFGSEPLDCSVGGLECLLKAPAIHTARRRRSKKSRRAH